MNIPQIAPDKAQHFVYGAPAALIGAHMAVYLATLTPMLVWLTAWMGAIAGAALLGAAKEILDRVKRTGEPSVADWAWTVAPGVLMALALQAGK